MSSPISRRKLLGQGAQLALAAAGASGPAPGAWLGSLRLAPVRAPLRKCISLGSYGPLTVPDGHPTDYRLYGNREYVRDASGTRWIKLWVSWAHLQEELRPSSRRESWRHLNAAPSGEGALRRLDRQIRAVNDDAVRVGGMGVIVTIYHEYPTWSSGARAGDPARAAKPLSARTPEDVSPDSPWGWFIAHLCARYRRGERAHPSGPSVSLRSSPAHTSGGNPDGAFIDALEVCNEPNYLLWPQAGIHLKVAAMLPSAAAISSALRGPAILGPATSDFPDHPHETPGATDWLTFSDRVLAALAGFRSPGGRVGWSHHNYLDVSDEVSGAGSRARAVIELLDRHDWQGHGDRRLWLTEAGYDMYPRQDDPAAHLEQARKIERNYRAMSEQPGAWMWTQHTICDVVTNDFKSGLRADFRPGAGWGAARPAFETWARLPGSAAA